MRKLVTYIGVALVMVGGSGLDSPNLLIPIAVVVIGAVMALAVNGG